MDVKKEIVRSEDKFGNQDANPMQPDADRGCLLKDLIAAKYIKERNDRVMQDAPGRIDHMHIIYEEFVEATEETEYTALRKELVQLCCVTAKAIKALDEQHQTVTQ